ncbi:MAG TPA: cytochrome ubiquinol oxidase subunit I, partial [Sphingomonas sanguinis]|nr:cytochrome ubiquinol oxidase subunit I [Sphingomonas sanguinis]
TAFSGLVFGYYFFWTIHPDFGDAFDGPGVGGPITALVLSLASWAATLAAREVHSWGSVNAARGLLIAGAATAIASLFAGIACLDGLDPTANAYPAIVWVLVVWTVVHAAIAAIMQLYTLARSIAGRMTPTHDADIRNITVYAHFFALTAIVTYLTIGLFPESGL